MSEKVFLIPIDIWIYGIIILILSGSLFGYLISTGEKLTLDEEEGTEKEFQKAKKKLLSRIGELVPNQNAESKVSVLMQQLVWFRELEQRDILTEDEYNEQKKDILKLI